MEKEGIDFVVMWVDGNDPEWQKEKAKYDVNTDADGSIYRYRDWDLLQYWFRGVEKFAPWVRKVHFVTWGHIPKWLNTENPKLNIVKHQDFIPEKYLPTFSANSIETNLHRIEGLSNNFVFLNDDVYLIKNVKETDFFKGGVPLENAVLNVHCPKKSLISQYFCINDTSIVNEHFDFHSSIKKNFTKWFNIKNGMLNLRTLALLLSPRFPGFWQSHIASSYHKSTFEEVWELEEDVLDRTCSHKFREVTDVNQWVFKEWQIASGNFVPRSAKFGKSFYIDRDGISNLKKEILNSIKNQKYHMIAINDGPMTDEEYSDLIKDLKNAFDTILPERCSFEKGEDEENNEDK